MGHGLSAPPWLLYGLPPTGRVRGGWQWPLVTMPTCRGGTSEGGAPHKGAPRHLFLRSTGTSSGMLRWGSPVGSHLSLLGVRVAWKQPESYTGGGDGVGRAADAVEHCLLSQAVSGTPCHTCTEPRPRSGDPGS